MYRVAFLLPGFLLAGALPAFAEGFSQVQFVVLVVVNLALAAVVTLFVAVLVSLLLEKVKREKKIELRVSQHEKLS